MDETGTAQLIGLLREWEDNAIGQLCEEYSPYVGVFFRRLIGSRVEQRVLSDEVARVMVAVVEKVSTMPQNEIKQVSLRKLVLNEARFEAIKLYKELSAQEAHFQAYRKGTELLPGPIAGEDGFKAYLEAIYEALIADEEGARLKVIRRRPRLDT